MYETGYAPGEAMLARMDTRLTDDKLRHLYALTREDITKLQLADFDDASHVLDHRTTAAYLDAVHLSGDANGLVAHAIYDVWKDGSLTRYCNGRIARNQGMRPCVMFDSDRLGLSATRTIPRRTRFLVQCSKRTIR